MHPTADYLSCNRRYLSGVLAELPVKDITTIIPICKLALESYIPCVVYWHKLTVIIYISTHDHSLAMQDLRSSERSLSYAYECILAD